MLQRAYSLIDHVKSASGSDGRSFSGIATSIATDRMGDRIDPTGVKAAKTLPLLLYHDSKRPVGEVTFGKATPQGIPFSATISKIDRSGTVQDRLNEALDSLQANPPLIRGVSIGFRPLEDPTYNKETGGFDFSSIEVLELSMVVIPANQDATIHTVKSFDVDLPATGTETGVVTRKTSPGVSGTARVVVMRGAPEMKTSYADQITKWEATRAAKAAAQDAIQTKASDEGRGKTDEEREEFATMGQELDAIDAELKDLRALETREKAAAVPAAGATPREGLQARQGTHISVERKLPPGHLFARYAICIANSRGMAGEAERLARKHYPDDQGVLALLEKTAVAGGSTSGSHWLDDMVPYNVMNDFIEYLRPGSIIGKFGGPNPGGGPNYPSLNRVGFNERVSGMSTGFTAGWKGEGLPALPSAAVTFNTSLTWNCMSALAVLTKEAIRFSNPSAEARVRDELARAVNGKLDNDFIDPAKAASGTTSPASITNNVVATAPTAATAAAAITDLATLIANFATNNLDPSDIVLIMSAQQALQYSMMTNTLGNPVFPSITMAGGTLRGFPVIVSQYLTSIGSPTGEMIVAVKASDVYLADDGVVTVEASDQASIEMVDTSSQSAISGTGASLVSLWQTGAVGLMANREITWKMRRATSVQYIAPAAYKA